MAAFENNPSIQRLHGPGASYRPNPCTLSSRAVEMTRNELIALPVHDERTAGLVVDLDGVPGIGTPRGLG